MKQLSGFFGRWTGGQTSTTALPRVTVDHVSIAVRGDPGDDGPVDELIVAGTAFGTVQLLLSCLSLISFHVFRLRVIQSRVFSSSQESTVSNLISRRTIALFWTDSVL